MCCGPSRQQWAKRPPESPVRPEPNGADDDCVDCEEARQRDLQTFLDQHQQEQV